jgi:hypothetical protein
LDSFIQKGQKVPVVIPPCSVIRVFGASRLFVVTNIILGTRHMIVSVGDVITISAGMLRI